MRRPWSCFSVVPEFLEGEELTASTDTRLMKVKNDKKEMQINFPIFWGGEKIGRETFHIN